MIKEEKKKAMFTHCHPERSEEANQTSSAEFYLVSPDKKRNNQIYQKPVNSPKTFRLFFLFVAFMLDNNENQKSAQENEAADIEQKKIFCFCKKQSGRISH